MHGIQRQPITRGSIAALLVALVMTLAPAARAAHDPAESDKPKEKSPLSCEMTYDLKGWSASYKTAKGTGTITCSNGQKADVKLKVNGGGITFGKTEIVGGTAKITGGRSIEDIYG